MVYGFDPWVGKIPGKGNDNRLQYSCLENLAMDILVPGGLQFIESKRV